VHGDRLTRDVTTPGAFVPVGPTGAPGKAGGRRRADDAPMNDTTALIDAPPAGARIVARGLTTVHRNGTTALDAVDLVIEPGSVTAVIGPSGAGKTTLLAALAGVAPAQGGTVSIDPAGPGPVRVGYVPQDDILHGDLPLRRTLRYAAALRLDTSDRVRLDAAVDRVVRSLGLEHQAHVRVADLSGGQRKRASIACELLTRPAVCFLDEPTSGLDPAAAAALLDDLHELAAGGSTVMLTTHSIADIERSDHIVLLAPGGRIVSTGAPADVLRALGAGSFAELYEQPPSATPHRREPPSDPRPPRPRPPAGTVGPGASRQWAVLTARVAETLARGRLTLAITLGSPVAVTAMFVVLFRPGTFGAGADPATGVQIAYWLAFAGFFFGLTFGLLQVCTEVPVLRRERHAGVRVSSYLLAKVAVLGPMLLAVNVALVATLHLTDRLPSLSVGDHVALQLTMALNAGAALCLGLAASAAVTTTAQAALALPMLCFPAVLFAGAMVPVPVMATAGQTIAAAMPNRWAFEAIARHLEVATAASGTPHASLGASASPTYWVVLAGFTVALGAVAHVTVRLRAA
jgi:ABC-type multidrug transport system ATPase subunit